MRIICFLLGIMLAYGAGAETIVEVSIRLDHLLEQIDRLDADQIVNDCDNVIKQYRSIKSKEIGLLVAQAWSVRGSALTQNRSYQEAIKSHQKSYGLRQRYAGFDSMEAARSCHNLGNCYLLIRDFEESEKWLLKSLRLKQLNNGDDGSTNESLGSLYIRMDKHSLANRHLQDAIRLRPANSLALINTFLALGSLWNGESKPDSALHCFERALRIYDLHSTDQTQRRATILDKIGVSLSKLGYYEKSKAVFTEVLQILNTIQGINPIKKGECLQNAGDCYLNIGDYETASSLYETAITCFEGDSFEMATLLNSMGLLAHRRSDDHRAIELFRRAITILETGYQSKVVAAKAAVFLNLGTLYLEDERWENATFYFHRSAQAFTTISDQSGQIKALNKMGYCELKQGDLDIAESCFRASIQPGALGALVFPSFFHLGEVFEAKKNTDMALLYYHQALRALDEGLLGDNAFPTEKALIYTAIARVHASLAVNESPKWWPISLAWADAATQILATVKSSIGSHLSVAANNHYFSETYNIAIEACLALRVQSPHYEVAAFDYMEQYRSNFARQLALRYGQFSGDSIPNYAAGIKPLKDIQQNLESEEVLLAYQWLPDKIVLFELRSKGLQIHIIKDPYRIGALIQTFWSACSQYPEWIPSQQKDSLNQTMIQAGAELYQRLLGDCHLKPSARIKIAPDYLLCYLPFDALIKSNSPNLGNFWEHRYVIDDHVISYTISASAPDQIKNIGIHHNKSLWAIAPDFSNSEDLPNLRYNRAETQRIWAVYKADGGTQKTVNVAKFKENAAHFGILHFATHGILNQKDPSLSYLAFSRYDDSTGHERLYAKDIYMLRLNANLVVMSACHSADGKLYRGEGLASLAHAFQYAGVSNVVASLWNVDDQSSPLMMENFYKEIKRQKTPSKALATVKKIMIHQKRNKSHPYYWAGFINWGG